MKNKSIKQISEELNRDYRTIHSFALKVMEVSNRDNVLKKLQEGSWK
jgi:hypothetical protein